MINHQFLMLTREQWARVAEWWRATHGALPQPSPAEAHRMIDTWFAAGQPFDPPQTYAIVDVDGNLIRWIPPSTLGWVSLLFAAAMRAQFDPPLRPEWERQAESLRRAEEGARLWH